MILKPKAAVFASGTGSNFQAIMDYEDLKCEIAVLVCDQKEAAVIEKARRNGVKIILFDPKAYESKAHYEQELVHKLRAAHVTWIFLAGYMRIVGPTLLEAYENKIINIHPSLLPQFPGNRAVAEAFEAGVQETGVTIHYVDEGIDTGPIIAQEKVDIRTDDTFETLKSRIHQVEHQLYPRVINHLVQEKGEKGYEKEGTD